MQDTQLIIRQFEISAADEEKTYSEAELETLLSEQILYMLEHRIDFLLSLLYRLDVAEQKINEALLPGALLPPHLGLARLVMERQKERLATKASHRQKQNDNNWQWDEDESE